MSMTHAELVQRAGRWLRNTERCTSLALELVTCLREVPDAFGWKNAGRTSVLVECKTSRDDLCADRRKPSRRHPEQQTGGFRWYLCEREVLDKAWIPQEWGLLWVCGKVVRRIVHAPYHHSTISSLQREAKLWHGLVQRMAFGGAEYGKNVAVWMDEQTEAAEPLPEGD